MNHRLAPALIATLAVLATAVTTAPAVAGTAPRSVAPTQDLVTLLDSQNAHAKPSARSASVGVIPGKAPITGERTTLPVLGTYGSWLLVRLPGRPNGHTGWISEGHTTTSVTAWQLVVDTATRRVLVYHAGHVVKTIEAVVGKPSTPTPTGTYFVEEAVALGKTAVGAPFALALSARSSVLQDFDGGPGQIAIHGLLNVGGTPGTAASHGCIRIATPDIKWLAGRISPGTPVTIE